VHLYKIFSARRYIALTASVKFGIGSPKMARNEQFCANQKSYRMKICVVAYNVCKYLCR